MTKDKQKDVIMPDFLEWAKKFPLQRTANEYWVAGELEEIFNMGRAYERRERSEND